MEITHDGCFGTTAKGERVSRYMLRGRSIEAGILTFGGIIQLLRVPDRKGAWRDVVLGCGNLTEYEQQDKFLGALIGRHANRIARGRFHLNSQTYSLPLNDGRNHLHGGPNGFHQRIWRAEPHSDGLHLFLESPDGDQGYPGNLRVEVIYSIDADNGLVIEYFADSDRDTLCNLTNHAYFNLSGQGSGSILNHMLEMPSTAYTPTDAESLPTGQIAPVHGTPMDFRHFTPIGARIADSFTQLRYGMGYDHNWVVRGEFGTLRSAARAYSPDSGIIMSCETTMPGLQFYSGNHLAGSYHGKAGRCYYNREGFCLETQFFPNARSCPAFPQPILRAGDRYHHKTIYRFSIKN